MEDTSLQPPALPLEEEVVVADTPTPQAEVCQSCNSIAELFDVPHHQEGNTTVWRYCKRCKLAHDVEVATNVKLKEVVAVNPSAANDPVFVSQIRDQITRDLMQV
jgi:hypothetical protein